MGCIDNRFLAVRRRVPSGGRSLDELRCLSPGMALITAMTAAIAFVAIGGKAQHRLDHMVGMSRERLRTTLGSMARQFTVNDAG